MIATVTHLLTNKNVQYTLIIRSIHTYNNVIPVRNIMNLKEQLLDFDKISENRRNIYE